MLNAALYVIGQSVVAVASAIGDAFGRALGQAIAGDDEQTKPDDASTELYDAEQEDGDY